MTFWAQTNYAIVYFKSCFPGGGEYSHIFGWWGCAARKTPLFSPKIGDLIAFVCSNLANFSLWQKFWRSFCLFTKFGDFFAFWPWKAEIFSRFYFLKYHIFKFKNWKIFRFHLLNCNYTARNGDNFAVLPFKPQKSANFSLLRAKNCDLFVFGSRQFAIFSLFRLKNTWSFRFLLHRFCDLYAYIFLPPHTPTRFQTKYPLGLFLIISLRKGRQREYIRTTLYSNSPPGFTGAPRLVSYMMSYIFRLYSNHISLLIFVICHILLNLKSMWLW